MATLSVLRSRVRYNAGGRSDKDAIIDTLLNATVDQLARKYNWNDLMAVDATLSLSIADYSKALPDGVRLVDYLKLKDAAGNYYRVYIRDRQTFRDLYSEIIPTTSGTPSDCFIMGRTIYFDRKADKAYTVYMDVHQYAAAMSDDADTPSIYGIDELIVALATARLYLHLKQADVAETWFTLANAIAQDALDEIIGDSISQLDPW